MELIIDDRKYTNFSSYTINLRYDAISSGFSFDGMDTFIPNILTYNDIRIDENNKTLLTGKLLAPKLIKSTSPNLRSLSGYSLPGKLEDVSIPIDLYPLEYERLTLREVADKILSYFDIDYVIDNAVHAEMNKAFEKINDDPGKSPKQLINKLASQRNIILSHTNKGEVLFTKLDANKLTPVFSFNEGDYGITKLELSIDAQAMHSTITVMKQASKKNPDAGEYTISNPYVDQTAKRPLVKTLSSGDIYDTQKAARNELSREIATLKLTIESTKYVAPGELIEVQAPSIEIHKKNQFVVRETEIKGDAKGDETYTLSCVPKDVYTMQTPPDNIFVTY